MGQPVVTDVRAQAGDLASMPLLGGALYSLEVAALLVGRSENAISIALCRYPDRFDDPHYQRDRRHNPRRLVTEHDIAALRAMYPVYVVKRRVRAS